MNTDNAPWSESELSALRESLRAQMSEKRYVHTVAVEDMVARLCAVYCPEETNLLRAAALLHDLTKELDAETQKNICRERGIALTPDDEQAPKTFHARTAAALIPEQYPTFDAFANSYVGVGEDGDWKAELQDISKNMVCKDMISYAIAELEDMKTVTEEEFKAELKYWVDYYQGYMTEAEILSNMGEETIRAAAFGEKIQKWLLEQATFTFESAAE